MAVPAWALAAGNQGAVDVMIEPSVDGNFSAFGGGAAGLNDETQYFIQGAECKSKNAWTSGLKGMTHDEAGTDLAVGTGEVCMVWVIYSAPTSTPLTDNSGGGETGMQIRAGIGADANYFYFNVGDDLTLANETWVPWVVNWDNSLETGVVGTPGTGTIDWIGAGADIASGPNKGSPFGIDAIRYGRFELDYTGGQAANYGTFAATEVYSNANARRWGVIEATADGTFRIQGFHSFGTSGTLCDFRDSGQVIFIRATPFAPSTFSRLEVVNASTNVEWDNIIIKALGTGTGARGIFVHTAGTVAFTNCQFIDMDTFSFLAAASATVTTSTFRGCNEVTAPGTDLTGTKILEPTVAVNSAGLIWNVNTDPDGLLDSMEFTKGANAHHAISFGNLTPAEITLTDIAFGTAWNALHANNDSTLLFADTGSDITWTVNLSGCTGTITYKKARGGDTVLLVIDPVTTEITCKDIVTGAVIENVRVLLLASDNTGDLPFEETPIGINNVTTQAQVNHTAHGLAVGDYVFIQGANEQEYNGTFEVSVVDGVDDYRYEMQTDPGGSATGTLLATGGYFNEKTNVSGIVTDTRSITQDQPVDGWCRKGTTSPFYKQAPIDEVVSSATGLSLNVFMIPDE